MGEGINGKFGKHCRCPCLHSRISLKWISTPLHSSAVAAPTSSLITVTGQTAAEMKHKHVWAVHLVSTPQTGAHETAGFITQVCTNVPAEVLKHHQMAESGYTAPAAWKRTGPRRFSDRPPRSPATAKPIQAEHHSVRLAGLQQEVQVSRDPRCYTANIAHVWTPDNRSLSGEHPAARTITVDSLAGSICPTPPKLAGLQGLARQQEI